MSVALLRDLTVAVEHELAATSGSDLVALADARHVASSGARSVWSFAVESAEAESLHPDVPGRLIGPDGSTVEAWVLAVGDESLVLSVPLDFQGGNRWILASDARFIYQRLLDRLEELRADRECDEALLVELVSPDLPSPDDEVDGGQAEPHAEPDLQQELAARRAIQPGVRFTWGPPGTGKTRVLGKAVAAAAAAGNRVLVLAHANAAVDVAVLSVAEEAVAEVADEADEDVDDERSDELSDGLSLDRDGWLVRVGTPQVPALADRSELLPHDIAGATSPDLMDRIDTLRAELRHLSDDARSAHDGPLVSARIQAVRDELRDTRSELEDAARLVVDEAAVVATTLARAVIDDQIWSSHFDVVVIDEASMAPLPIVLALVMRGATTVSFFGDFRQLPPVAVSDHEVARAYFARDVFEYGQVVHLHELGAADPRLTTLTTQFRMGEGICGVVNDLAYDGMLRTAPTARDAAVRAAERGVGPGAELVVVDTSSLEAVFDVEVSPNGWSRVNLRHAVLAASLAQSLRADDFASVGVISPYRAQAQILASLLRRTDGVEAATIHRFQGSECDGIVLDLTDARPRHQPSRLTGIDGELALRLLNVAVSRARHKLVVLADGAFLAQLQSGVIERKVVDLMFDRAAVSEDGLSVARALVASDRATGARPGKQGPVWADSWAAAAPWLESALDVDSTVEANVLDDIGICDWLVAVEDRLSEPSRSIVRASGAAVGVLGSTGFDARLHTRGGTPWVVVDERLVAVGAGPDDGPVAVAADARVAGSVRRALAPKEN